MTQQFIDIWNQSADAFTERYDLITDEQLSAVSPCDGWTVQELVDHAVGVQVGYAGGLVGADIAEGADWPTARDAIRAALESPDALDGTTEMGPMGTVPKSIPFSVAAADLLIHTWDVARAIGADETLPAGPVTAAYMGLQRFPEEAMRGEGMFGAAIESADDADEQTKMLNFAGRVV